MNKKRGYFFVLDAVIGMLMITIAIVIISSHFVRSPQQTQVKLISDNLLTFMATTKIVDLNNPYAGLGGELWKNGTITESGNTLFEQVGYFYEKKDYATAEKFIQNISREVVPLQFRYEVWINGTIIYPRAPAIEHNISKNETGLLLASRTIVFGVLNRTTGDMWGPYRAEVFAWER